MSSLVASGRVPGFGLEALRRLWSRSSIIAAACLLALSALGGCSALRVGYSTAPDLVYWWLDGYIDFDSNQAPRVREAIAQWFAWNRKTQLSDYADLLVRAQKDVLVDTTPARACDWQREIVKRVRLAYDRIEPATADIMLTVTPEQIAHLEKRYTKYNEEFREEYLQSDPRERAKANVKRTLERAEMLYGRLDDAQRARIAEQLARSPFDADVWFIERRQRQLEALSMLRGMGPDGAMTREQAIAALRGYADHMERSPREAYRRYSERLAEFNCSFAASLHNGTTPAQRRTAAKKLAGWEADLRAIVAQANRGG